MQRKIIVGYDGSDASKDALALARRLAGTVDGRLVLASVYPHEYPPFRADPGAYERLMREDARQVLSDAPSPADAELRAVPAPSPSHGLHHLAGEPDTALLVVGSSRKSRHGHVGLGSVTHGLLHGTPCAVAVAPAGYAGADGAPFRRIMVGYVDTEEGRAALRVAGSLAARTGARLDVVSVVEPIPMPLLHRRESAWEDYLSVVRDEVGRSLNEALATLPEGVEASGHLLEGQTVQCLCREAEQGADLIVTGSRGYGALGRVLLGSVAAGLMDRSPVPVLVVPRGASSELLA